MVLLDPAQLLIRIGIQGNYTDPADPDPQHCVMLLLFMICRLPGHAALCPQCRHRTGSLPPQLGSKYDIIIILVLLRFFIVKVDWLIVSWCCVPMCRPEWDACAAAAVLCGCALVPAPGRPHPQRYAHHPRAAAEWILAQQQRPPW